MFCYFVPWEGYKVLQWAWLCVPMSVHSHISKTTCPNFTEYSAHLTCGRWQHCKMLCIYGLWMMSCFHIMVPVGHNRRRHYVSWSSPGDGTKRRELLSANVLLDLWRLNLSVLKYIKVHFTINHWMLRNRLYTLLGSANCANKCISL